MWENVLRIFASLAVKLKIITMTENQIGKIVVDCAYKVHKELGPGLLESTYEACLNYELIEAGLKGLWIICKVNKLRNVKCFNIFKPQKSLKNAKNI